MSDLRGGAARSVDEAAVAIVTAARRMSVRLSPHESVLARARAATKKISERVEQAAAAGDLQYFNVLFQQKRKAAALTRLMAPTMCAPRSCDYRLRIN